MEVKRIKINDIFKDIESEKLLEKCLEFREEDLCHVDEDDKKYLPNFDYYSKKILKNTTKKVYNYVSKKLDSMYDDFIDYYSYYYSYWNDKDYMTEFNDAVKLLSCYFKIIISYISKRRVNSRLLIGISENPVLCMGFKKAFSVE